MEIYVGLFIMGFSMIGGFALGWIYHDLWEYHKEVKAYHEDVKAYIASSDKRSREKARSKVYHRRFSSMKQ